MKARHEAHLLARFRFYSWVLVGVWTACIAGSLVWNLRQQTDHTLEMARRSAQITFENDVLYRRWAAQQGGVYVRASEEMPPNHYLQVPERDVTTTSGLDLTLVNPAYMVRQVNALADATRGSRGHLTSLNPIRPENAPDAWEAAALRSFEQGVQEVSSVEKMGDGEYLRLMRPFVTERGCLKCHAAQGYKEGDIRGGVSVSVPMAALHAIEGPMTANLALAHVGLWLVGLVGIGVSRWGLGREFLARERAEEGLRTTLESIGDGFFACDADWRFLFVNAQAERILGLRRAEMLGKNYWEVFPGALGTNVEDEYRRVAEGTVREFENFNEARGRWFKKRCFPREGGGLSVYLEDITERKRSEEERELTVELLRLVNESKDSRELVRSAVTFFKQRSGCEAVGVRLREGDDYPYYETQGFPEEFVLLENHLCTRDAAGQIQRDTEGNPLIECMCGSVICGRFNAAKPFFTANGSFWTNSTTELLAGTTESDRQARTRNRCNGEGYESVALVALRAGEERLGLLQLNDKRRGMFSAETIALWERLGGYLAVAVAKLRTDEALRQSRADLDHAQAVGQIGSWRLDVRQNVLTWSDETHRIFGVSQGTPLSYERFLETVHPDDRQYVDTQWQAALRGQPYDLEHRVVVGQQVKWVREKAYLELDETGKVLGGFGIAQDITERKRIEQQLQQAKNAAEAASKAKDQFIAVLSHELRTPLTPALFAASAMEGDERLPSDTREDLAMIRRNIALEVRLIADLLDVSRVISGKLHLDQRPTDVAAAIREAVKIVTSDLHAKGQILTVETPGAPYLMPADPARLQQVFWNLLRNAVKFTPQRGQIALRAELVAAQHCPLVPADGVCPVEKGACPLTPPPATRRPPQRNLVIEVTDTGSGIAPDMLPRLFNAFEQAREARAFGGLGLGLSICKAVVEMHGGAISARSAGLGQGATFTVDLPVAQCPLPASTSDAEAGAERRAGKVAKPLRVGQLRILLVEDDADTARYAQRLLSTAGYEVHSVNSVQAALAAVAQHTFDLLLSDLGLPDGSGLDFMRELRSRGHTLPGIALTGFGQEADVRRAQEAGFAAHLTKPIDFQQFEMTIAELTRQPKASE